MHYKQEMSCQALYEKSLRLALKGSSTFPVCGVCSISVFTWRSMFVCSNVRSYFYHFIIFLCFVT